MIELVVVIVILAVLAATAMPRLFDLGRDARVAALNGLAGTVATADSMMYTYAAAKGMTDGWGYIYPFEDKTAKVYVVCGHPNQTTTGILAALTGTASNRKNSNGAVTYDYGQFSFAITINDASWSMPSAKDPSNCKVTYQFDQMSCDGEPVPIQVETSGC